MTVESQAKERRTVRDGQAQDLPLRASLRIGSRIRTIARREVLIGLLNFAWIVPLAAALTEVLRFFRYEPPTTDQTRFTLGTAAGLPKLPTYVETARGWLHRDDAGLFAVDAVCTHLGCTVKLESDAKYECPCHGSRFAPDGAVLRGPASIPLRFVALEWSGDRQLIVDPAMQVDAAVRLPEAG